MPKPAFALVGAGYNSLTSLQGATWEQLCRIPGVAARSLVVIEALLGEPLPRERPGRAGRPEPPWPEHLWRRRGLATEAAITFAQMKMTVEKLKGMSREELLGLRGVGVATVKSCELIIGRAIPSRGPDPGEVFWRRQGLVSRAARALSQAGYRSPEALQGVAREDLLALRGFGATALSRLEKALGRKLERRGARRR